jgi:pyruvate dehydrogenase (quinone)/pyruvate decarboxylase
MSEQESHIDRRGFLKLGGSTLVGTALLAAVASAAEGKPESPAPDQAGEDSASVVPQPSPDFQADQTTADILIEMLIAWGATHVFGIVGDGIAGVIEAIRKRQDRLAYIGTRHEEAAAFMASAHAKLTGRLGVCVSTTGPGAIHLLNGLYDAAYDGAPVVAITGLTFHDLQGTRFFQALDTPELMQQVALYNVAVTSPGHALIVGNRACRAALGNRGVAHLAVSKDVQNMKLSADKPSMENHGLRTSSSWLPRSEAPGQEQLQAAADLLNAGQREAILAGQGALNARAELEQLADTLGAPVAKALLGRNVNADDSPFSTGGIGHLGTAPSSWIMQHCDTVLILGSTMPWVDYYPKPGQARGVQVDINPDRIGLRYPVELGLIGDTQATLRGLLPLLKRKAERGFLTETQARMRDWNGMLDRIEARPQTPLLPQMVVRALSDALADDAIVTLDCGANSRFAARHLRLKTGQRLISPGMLVTMAPALPYAVSCQATYPGRQTVAIAGDGGFAMLMAELSTAVFHKLPIKVLILNNSSLGEVTFEQKEAGFGVFGCDLGTIDFVAYANAVGAEGFRCATPEEVGPAIAAALRSPGPAIIDAIVDVGEEPPRPEHMKA